jgi:hypothetical protein
LKISNRKQPEKEEQRSKILFKMDSSKIENKHEAEIDIETGDLAEMPNKSLKDKKKKVKSKKSHHRVEVESGVEIEKKKIKEIQKKKTPSSTKTETIPLGEDDYDSASEFSTDRESIVLSASEDPFAKRDGKTLIWQNINMTLVSHMARLNICVCASLPCASLS